MKKTLLLLTLLLSLFSRAQTPSYAWSEQIGNSGYDASYAIATDNAGNSYIAGYYSYTVDLDPGPGVFNSTPAGGLDIFIQKLDASRNLIWAKVIAGTADEYVNGIDLDTAGNILLTGGFSGTVDFNPGPAYSPMSSVGTPPDIFVLKLDPSGNYMWARKMGGTGGSKNGYAITNDPSNNVIVTGEFDGTVDFDPGSMPYNLTSAGQVDIFILKLDLNGNFMWVKQMGSFYDDRGYAIKTDQSGNIISTGRFMMQTDFDPGPGGYPLGVLSPTTDINMYVQKLDPAGNFIWARELSLISNIGYGLDVDSNDDIVITGYNGGSADFDPGPDTLYLPNAGAYDIFVMKLDSPGELVWAHTYGGTGYDIGRAVDIGPTGNIAVTGSFQFTSDFDPTAGTMNLTSNGASDIFTFELDANGNTLWVTKNGGTNDDFGRGISTDGSGSIYTCGYFENTVDMDFSAGITSYTSAGLYDAFVIKLNSGITTTVDEFKESLIQLFPNPTNGKFTLSANTQPGSKIKVYNSLGMVVMSIQSVSNETVIDLLDHPKGIYLIQIESLGGVQTKKIIKQ